MIRLFHQLELKSKWVTYLASTMNNFIRNSSQKVRLRLKLTQVLTKARKNLLILRQLKVEITKTKTLASIEVALKLVLLVMIFKNRLNKMK